MTAHRFDPFANSDGFQRLQEEFGRLIDGDWLRHPRADESGSDWRPSADSIIDSSGMTVVIDLPGVSPDSVEVAVHRGELRVSGSRSKPVNTEPSVAEHDARTRRERPGGRFERRFTLPESADASKISAKGELGVLTITVPLGQVSEAQTVDINWSDSRT